MPASQSPPVATGLRWARAVTVAALSWAAASAAHVSAGGALPSWLFIVALVALTAWPLSLALPRRAGAVRLSCLLGAGQGVMHVALVVASWSTDARAGLSPGANAHAHAGMPGMGSAGTDALAGTGASHVMPLLPSPLMALAHIVAALVLGAILSDGERVLFLVWGLLAHLRSPASGAGLGILSTLALLAADTETEPDPVGKPRTDLPQRRLRERVLVVTLGRRGPPVHAAL